MGRLEDELARLREEIEGLLLLAGPRKAELTDEEAAYLGDLLATWEAGEPWSVADVPDHLFAEEGGFAGGSGITVRDYLPALKEMVEDGYFDSAVEGAAGGPLLD